jgi:hypothetical protein
VPVAELGGGPKAAARPAVGIDTFESDLTDFEAELETARTETGIELVVQRAAAADMPWQYQDRLQRELPRSASPRARSRTT